jgi:hypothetical protein
MPKPLKLFLNKYISLSFKIVLDSNNMIELGNNFLRDILSTTTLIVKDIISVQCNIPSFLLV